MSSNGNVHYRAASPSSAFSPQNALDKQKHLSSSPRKLMIGVPPAATPKLSSSANGTSVQQLDHQNHAHHPNGTVNGSIAAVAKGKQKHVDPAEHVHLAQLEQELPLEEADLVSLAALVERLANHGYESLQNLAETLPSLPSSSRRAKIFNTALDVRKQFIKLLVLSRWSKDVADLQKSRNIIALLSEQQWQHEDVFAGLTDIRKILPNARMRNADLPTAIDVLQTGTYRRLPASIKDMAVAPKPFTDQQVLTIVSRLEDALRTRMACRELVPAPLSDYSIRDGKVHFRVQGLFEAQLTASSGGRDRASDALAHSLSGADATSTANEVASAQASADDRWWLLDLSFDAIATGSCAASSSKAFPKKPKKAYRERLRIWGDQELAPRSQRVDESKPGQAQQGAQRPEDTEGAQPTDEKPAVAQQSLETERPTQDRDDDPAIVKLPSECDVPLLRLFSFLQERSLHYQMDILQHQAYELCRLNWGSNLRIETGERPRRLTVHYWTQAQGASGAAQKVDSPAAGGSVHIAIVDLADQTGATKTLAKLFDDDDHDEQSSSMTVKRRGLQVTWDAHGSILADSETSDLTISPHSLDIEALLSLVIQRHSSALLRSLQRRILIGDHPVSRLLRPEDCTLCVEHAQRHGDEFSTATETTSFHFLQIELHGNTRQAAKSRHASMSAMPPLRLSVDPVTGRLLLDSESYSITTDLGPTKSLQQSASFTAPILTTRPTYARLAEASDRINSSVEALFDVLYKLEVFVRVEDWERMASYLGLRTVRRLNLRPQDLAKLGPSASPESAPQLFIALRNTFPGYFLALQPSELAGANIALVYVVQIMDATGAPSLTVQSIEWLDRAKIASASKARRDAHADGSALAGQKRKRASGVVGQLPEVDASLGKRELTMEELGTVHSYCIALVSYFRVEQQLRMRGVPYLHVGSATSRSAPPAKWQRRPAPPAQARTHADARDNGLFDDEEAEGAAAEADVTPEMNADDLLVEESSGGVGALVPTLCLRAADLLGPARSHLARPNVSVRVCHWDDGDRSYVQMLIKLRMKSRRLRALHQIVAYASASDQHSTSPATWIDFDDETSLLTLSTRDLDNCLPIFYAQWERLMRMIQVTREVLNASRAWQQRALRFRISCKKPLDIVELRRFDFDAVLFSYGTIRAEDRDRQLLVRVRWQDAKVEMTPFNAMPVTQSGGFIVEFGSIPAVDLATIDAVVVDAGATASVAALPKEDALSKWFHDGNASANPHNAMAFELRRTVNMAARTAAMSAMTQPHLERMVWKGFFKLLQDTLPLMKEIAPLAEKCLTDPDVPEVEIKGATWFRLRFQDRFALDIRLTTRSRLIVSDASRALFRSETQPTGDAGTQTAESNANACFSGSNLLNHLVSGKSGAVEVDTTWKLSRIAVDAAATLSASQFQPIPNIDSVFRKVHTTVRSDSNQDGQKVWDLRRALIVSLALPLTTNDIVERKVDDGLLGKILPLLIQLVSVEIQSDSG
ncbi:related to RNA polymerase II mediator complex protein pmc1 [Melanopsichium pennsylvanicum]|uniref:Mediator of RNA polymerase II transcription subunit 14 n=2 Tax=Melanopsichium pennsylvanicum TaxID=63383 RepID=A0AAJ5C5B7_9BASI|nr:related to RNA polymerase II mediator complex protein pmc1 [Melanopsichium pennsylvanicum 4]SNX84570.1 related to RNA polymerase II mediator complex protein pmc1 [Melanopsichium pennsylvanicum]